ncbi:hypothetical protein [Sulfitobacter sp. D7]|jgi:hypothetical protein|uniref:hypothetical protein n=1 Tax=Sulfitobacter sp. D7 TaxID=1968541 RepID=UPI000E77E873|nr:hypothetical protein [Sulfitobacter sp. D7]AYE85342.1 hypothetical protein B5M07_03985 [Sulfitobacter sp. D7]
MIKIDTPEGPIFAEAEIRGIPINPSQPPEMGFIDPTRRWQIQAERVWLMQPWIIEIGEGCEVFAIVQHQDSPRSWGKFATREAAAEFALNPPPLPVSIDPSDEDLNF